MPVKPTKIDRAPKNRWSAAERDTRGHAPHRRSDPPSGFGDLGVPANLVAALSADGIGEPFPIQAATIPDALAGRDVLGRGRTGSGKTLAFGLPMISRLAGSSPRERTQPRGLVLVPTRELACRSPTSSHLWRGLPGSRWY